MRSRLALPDVGALDAEQRAVHDSIVATRGNLDGPFLAWMHSPELASRAEKLGAFCRYNTGLDLLESELLILLVAARFRCVGERQIHEPIALMAGLTQPQADALWRREEATDLPARLSLLQRLAHELLATNRVSQTTYDMAELEFGPKIVVETVGVIGYYALVAFTLNAFEMTKS